MPLIVAIGKMNKLLTVMVSGLLNNNLLWFLVQ